MAERRLQMSDIIDAKIDWFIERLSYYKDGSKQDYEEIRDFLRWENYTADEIESIWYSLRATRKYKTVPAIGEIYEVYQEYVKAKMSRRTDDRYGDIISHNNTVSSSWKKMSMKEVLHVLTVIRKNSPSEWSFTDKEFWSQYDKLYWEFKECKDRGLNPEDMKDHLEYVFRQMSAGEWFKSMITESRIEVSGDRKGLQNFNEAIAVSR